MEIDQKMMGNHRDVQIKFLIFYIDIYLLMYKYNFKFIIITYYFYDNELIFFFININIYSKLLITDSCLLKIELLLFCNVK